MPYVAVVLLRKLYGVLFDSLDGLDRILLALVNEYLDLLDSECVLVLELLLDSFDPFLGCDVHTFPFLSVIISCSKFCKIFEFNPCKDEGS